MATVMVTRMRVNKTGGAVKAFFSVSLGVLEIDDMKLVEGQNGTFIGFPSRKYTNKEGKDAWANIVRLATTSDNKLTGSAQNLYDLILKAAETKYESLSGEELAPAKAAEEDEELPF